MNTCGKIIKIKLFFDANNNGQAIAIMRERDYKLYPYSLSRSTRLHKLTGHCPMTDSGLFQNKNFTITVKVRE